METITRFSTLTLTVSAFVFNLGGNQFQLQIVDGTDLIVNLKGDAVTLQRALRWNLGCSSLMLRKGN